MAEPRRRAALVGVDAAADVAWKLALDIHAHPELSGDETYAQAACTEVLLEAGFEVRPAPGASTGFVATLLPENGRTGPTIGLLAEYDALPGIGHGCGHHLIAGSAVAAALGLAAIREELPGTVKVFGCPAEETLTGKRAMLESGAFDGVDGVLTFHAHDVTSVMTRSTGSREVVFSFRGRPSHAASEPWSGASALDGVLLTMQSVNALRQLVRDGVRIHGIVTAGGDAHNVIPAFAQCRFGIRSSDAEELNRVLQRVIDCGRAGAIASGTELEVEYGAQADPIRPDEVLAQLMRASLEEIGERDLVDWDAMASTDFGDVSQVIPGALVSVATWLRGTPFHSHEAASQGDAEAARHGMLQGARAMALTTIDYMYHLTSKRSQEQR